jgi:hypothetical protein
MHAILQPDTIVPKKIGQNTYLVPPFVRVDEKAFKVDSLAGDRLYSKEIKRETNAVILFWNRNKILPLLP